MLNQYGNTHVECQFKHPRRFVCTCFFSISSAYQFFATLLTHFLSFKKHVWPVFIFVWIFAISVILTRAVRSKPSDRQVWRFGCHAFVIRLLYGPFGLLFRGCFPECAEHKRIRRNFFGCFVYGIVFWITIIATASRNLKNSSTA